MVNMANNDNKTTIIGKKQVLRNLHLCNVESITLAFDADEGYKQDIIDTAKIFDVPVIIGDSKQAIAQQYNIEVDCAVVATLKDI